MLCQIQPYSRTGEQPTLLLSEGRKYFGIDESGNFPPRPNALMDKDRKMIFSVSASNSEDDIRIKPLKGKSPNPRRRGELSKHRSMPFDTKYNGVCWGELNGVHSDEFAIVSESYVARQAMMSYLLMQAGFRAMEGQYAYVDRFWGRRDDKLNYTFPRAFEFFGADIKNDSVRSARFGDTRVPIVNYADRDAYLVWDRAYDDCRMAQINLSPAVLLDCMRFMLDGAPQQPLYGMR